MATIADELNAISVEHGYTGAAPKTIAGAIDALADTLAGTDVEERRTIAGAVKALAPYIGSGGGGSLGSMQRSMWSLNAPPVVGESVNVNTIDVSDVYIGSQHVIGPDSFSAQGVYYYNQVQTIASGARITYVGSTAVPAGTVITTDDISVNMYVITRGLDHGVEIYTSVTESNVEYSLAIRHSVDEDEVSYYDILITLTQPELDFDAGEILACYIEVPTGD